MNIFKRLFCRHINLHFLRNIYGDEIIHSGKRSVWACADCNAIVRKDELFDAAAASMSARKFDFWLAASVVAYAAFLLCIAGAAVWYIFKGTPS